MNITIQCIFVIVVRFYISNVNIVILDILKLLY